MVISTATTIPVHHWIIKMLYYHTNLFLVQVIIHKCFLSKKHIIWFILYKITQYTTPALPSKLPYSVHVHVCLCMFVHVCVYVYTCVCDVHACVYACVCAVCMCTWSSLLLTIVYCKIYVLDWQRQRNFWLIVLHTWNICYQKNNTRKTNFQYASLLLGVCID